MRILLDTNILVDFLRGIDAAADLIDKSAYPAISLITWMEILVGARDETESRILESWMGRFSVINIDAGVARTAVHLRRDHSLKLPDAIIWASAQVNNLLLMTRNTRDFPEDEPGIRVPYRV